MAILRASAATPALPRTEGFPRLRPPMTIAIAIRTGSAVVFAADSKITTAGVVGVEEDGSPRWQEQTYDNATKVVRDRSGSMMAMVAGHANIGQMAAPDFLSTKDFRLLPEPQEGAEEKLGRLVAEMVEQKRAYWGGSQVPPEQWRGPTVLFAIGGRIANPPRIWRVDFDGPAAETSEILTQPGIWLDGSYDEVFGLLYGFEPSVAQGLREPLDVPADRFHEATRTLRVLRPIDKLNLWAMPIQDAIDLAVFLATVQVQMDRFLPGTPACGGPIDVMVLQTAPEASFVAYPGKVVHHPHRPGYND